MREAICDEIVTSGAGKDFLKGYLLNASVKLGEVQLSAAKFLEMLPGELIEFEFNPQTVLGLYIEEERVADGRLVNKDGRLWLQIREVYDLEGS